MSEDFQARPGATTSDVGDLFVPSQVGVGVVVPEENGKYAVLALRLLGAHLSTPTMPIMLVVALDTERTVGLIVQLHSMLLDAGVDNAKLTKMLMQAAGKYREIAPTLDELRQSSPTEDAQ